MTDKRGGGGIRDKQPNTTPRFFKEGKEKMMEQMKERTWRLKFLNKAAEIARGFGIRCRTADLNTKGKTDGGRN